MTRKIDQRKAYIYAAVVVALWATVASAFKLTLRYIDHRQLLIGSSLVSTTALFLIIVLRGRLRSLVTVTGRELLTSMALGFLNPFLYYLILFKAYSMLPAHVAQPLNQTWAVILALLSIVILRQPITARSIGAVVISFAGVVVISTQGTTGGLRFSDAAGILLALTSAFIWAVYWIANLRDGRDDVVRLFLNFAFGSVYAALLAAVMRVRLLMPWPGLAGAAYVGCFEMGITFVLWLKALSLSETTAKVSTMVYIAPFISFVIIHFTVGESIRWPAVLGLLLIVTGIVIQHHRSRKRIRE